MSNTVKSLPTASFWVTRVPESVYSNNPEYSLRSEFEVIFRVYDENVQFNYLKSFNCVRVTFSSLVMAKQIKESLDTCQFQGTNLKVRPVMPVKIGSAQLGVPEKTKQLLISPPASPPVGWEQTVEAQPCMDFTLVTALASRLQLPGGSHEVLEGSAATPSIFVVAPDEGRETEQVPSVLVNQDKEQINMASLPRSIVQTSRPPLKS